MNIKKICMSLLAGSFTLLAAAVTAFGSSSLHDVTDSVKNCAKETYNNVAIQTKIIIKPIQQYFAVQESAVVLNNGQVMPYIIPSRQNYQDQLASEFLCANSGILLKGNLASLEEILRFSEYRGSG